MLSSFPIPPQDGEFYFSLVSFHASFVTQGGAIVLDIQDSRILLQTQFVQEYGIKQGQFSPDGRFFACGTSEDKIRIWQNTPTGYLPWRTLRPRLPFRGLLFSPTAFSISCCDSGGIQLFQPGNDPGPLPPTKVDPHHKCQSHLVAWSTDWVHIAMAKEGSNIVTILNSSSGNPQLISTDMEVQDIKIVDNTLFVVDRCRLVCWELEAGGAEDSGHCARRVVVETLGIHPDARQLTLSHDCSQVAFTRDGTVFPHDLRAPGPIANYVSADRVLDLQFSPDQYQLWLLTEQLGKVKSHPAGGESCTVNYHLLELAIMESGGFGDVVSESLATRQSWADLSSHGCSIRGSWVKDPKGSKLLWLPPNWRSQNQRDVKWNGNFLSLGEGHHPEPVIIQFHL